MRSSLLALVLLLALGGASAWACIWDEDTLRMEQRQFPGALELITGKFLHHSEAFYRWRIEDRERRLVETPGDLDLLDDLAVAYEKIGRPEKAIEIMLAKAKRKPGLYKTEANLGTFYIHAGNLEQGLVHIERAIEINPDAHFGREIYQALLVRYVLSRRKEGKLVLPLARGTSQGRSGEPDFSAFVIAARERDAPDGELTHSEKESEYEAAAKGVLGMLRFGNYKSPVLLEALGDLLGGPGYSEAPARRLASRAYLKASFSQTGDVREAYRAKAAWVLRSQTTGRGGHEDLGVEEVEKTLREELVKADAWRISLRENEAAWIAAGDDPEARYAELYYGEGSEDPVDARRSGELPWGAILGMAAVLILVNLGLFVMMRRKRRAEAERREARRERRA